MANKEISIKILMSHFSNVSGTLEWVHPFLVSEQ
jgi:hypothetical protein